MQRLATLALVIALILPNASAGLQTSSRSCCCSGKMSACPLRAHKGCSTKQCSIATTDRAALLISSLPTSTAGPFVVIARDANEGAAKSGLMARLAELAPRSLPVHPPDPPPPRA